MSGDPSTDRGINVAPAGGWAQGRAMPMTLAYAIALAEARSCLAALADGATDVDESSRVEHVLIALDQLHPDGPATYPLDGRQADLTRWLESAIDRMIELGGDALSLELLLSDLIDPIVDS